MLNLAKLIKPWKDSDSLNAHINLYGFWSETTFLTKSGDIGLVLSVPGVDYESLDNSEQQYAVKRLESAMKSFSEGFHVYQYLFKSNRPNIPFAHYDDELIDAAIDQRRRFFEAKRDRLYQIEIFYVVILEGVRSKTGLFTSLARIPGDPRRGLADLKAQFIGEQMRTLVRTEVERDRFKLEQRVELFTRQLADLTPIHVLGMNQQFSFLRRLVNFDAWRIAGKPKASQYLDYQIVNSNIEAERDHLRVGDHFVRVLTMKESIVETKPLVLDQLLKIPANFYAVTEWVPMPLGKARNEVNSRRKHFNMTKSGFISQVRDERKTSQRDELIDESKQADVENLGECIKQLGDGQSMGQFSFTLVLYAEGLQTIDQELGEFAGIFTNLEGELHSETYNQLNAFFAGVPGNYAHNLRKVLLLNSNYADLSFLFTIDPGERTNPQLNSEYLAVLETDNATPYFLNLHNGEVAHTLILGKTGSGKSFLCNFLLTNTQKYHPQTYIFDIGGSFESLTEIFGGTYLNVGQESRDFRINPFSLPESKENTQFLYSFFKVLIEGNDQHYRLDFKEERKLYEAIERMYVVSPDQRTLSTFARSSGSSKNDSTAGPTTASTDSCSTTPTTRSASPVFRRSTSPVGAMRPRFSSRCSSTFCIAPATRLRTTQTSRRSRRSCSTRPGSSSRTRPSAITSCRRRRPGVSTMPP